MKPLKLKWRKGPDGIRRADTLIGASLFIVQEGLKYVLQVNNSDPLFKSKSLSKCKAFAAKFRESSPIGRYYKTRIWYTRNKCRDAIPEYKCLICETDGVPVVYGYISSHFPYETKHEQQLRREFLIPPDKPVTPILLKRAKLYAYSDKEIQYWKKETPTLAEGDQYKGPIQQLRTPASEHTPVFYAISTHEGTIWHKHLKPPKDCKWRTIRKWAKKLIAITESDKRGLRGHLTIGALRLALRSLMAKTPKRMKKACDRLDMIFEQDVQYERLQTELLFRAREEWHKAEQIRKQGEIKKKMTPVFVKASDKLKKKKKGVLSKKERRRLAKEQKRLIDEYMEKKRLKKLKIKKQSKETRKR